MVFYPCHLCWGRKKPRRLRQGQRVERRTCASYNRKCFGHLWRQGGPIRGLRRVEHEAGNRFIVSAMTFILMPEISPRFVMSNAPNSSMYGDILGYPRENFPPENAKSIKISSFQSYESANYDPKCGIWTR